MTINDFKKYQSISKTISNLLFNENYSNKHDIKIIFNILLGFPYCLDTEGHYTPLFFIIFALCATFRCNFYF